MCNTTNNYNRIQTKTTVGAMIIIWTELKSNKLKFTDTASLTLLLKFCCRLNSTLLHICCCIAVRWDVVVSRLRCDCVTRNRLAMLLRLTRSFVWWGERRLCLVVGGNGSEVNLIRECPYLNSKHHHWLINNQNNYKINATVTSEWCETLPIMNLGVLLR